MTSPLAQVTTLVNTSNKGPSSKKKGRSKKAHVLAVSVEQATQNFLEKGEQIAKDSQDLKEELIAAVEDVRKQGELVECSYAQCLCFFFPVLSLYCFDIGRKNALSVCNIPAIQHQICSNCSFPSAQLLLFFSFIEQYSTHILNL